MKMRPDQLRLVDKKMEYEIARFIKIIGKDRWKRSIEKYEAQVRSSSVIFYKDYLLHRNPLLEPVMEFNNLIAKKKSVRKHNTDSLMKLLSIAFIINRVYDYVNTKGKRKIKGILSTDDISSLLFEMQVVTHYLMNGYEVIFNDIEDINENGYSYDLLVRSDREELEVECKRKDINSGRKIKSDSFSRFADAILRDLHVFPEDCFISVSIEGDFTSNVDKIRDIAELIRGKVIDMQSEFTLEGGISVTLKALPRTIEGISDEEFKIFIQNEHLEAAYLTASREGSRAVVLQVESETANRKLQSIYDSLKTASKQLTGKRPAMIACYIEGVVGNDEWSILRNESGLRNMTYKFFESKNRSHIKKVIYSGDPTILGTSGLSTLISHSLAWTNRNFDRSL